MTPIPYGGVVLSPGRLADHFARVTAEIARIDDDALLLGFRRRAGRPAPGDELGGWYSADRFHGFGQLVTDLVKLAAVTGDGELGTRAVGLLEEWGHCVDADGYFCWSDEPNAPHYVYDKLVGALLDAHELLGYDATTHLTTITAWARANLVRPATAAAPDEGEWYTLSENLYRAALVLGDEQYADFARVWENRGFWDALAAGRDPVVGSGIRWHAFSHVNSLGGAAAAYDVTGDRHYLDVLERGFDWLLRRQVMPGGGYGPGEELVDGPGRLLDLLLARHAGFETQCGTWGAFKLAGHVLRLLDDPRAADWVEALLLNGLDASLDTTTEGRPYYYTDYHLSGGQKKHFYPTHEWACCAVTRPHAWAELHRLVAWSRADALTVGQYLPSVSRWGQVVLHQTHEAATSGHAELRLELPHPQPFSLRLRRPEWCADNEAVTVNGAPVQSGVDHGWLQVTRTWQDGDQVRLTLSRTTRELTVAPAVSALLDGPVLLVSTARGTVPLRDVPAGVRYQAFVVDGHALDGVELDHGDGWAPRWRPYWVDDGEVLESCVAGAVATATVEGTALRVVHVRAAGLGVLAVEVDGKVVARVDQHHEGAPDIASLVVPCDEPGRHVVRLLAETAAPVTVAALLITCAPKEVHP